MEQASPPRCLAATAADIGARSQTLNGLLTVEGTCISETRRRLVLSVVVQQLARVGRMRRVRGRAVRFALLVGRVLL